MRLLEPYRGPGPGRPDGLPVPPQHMPLRDGHRPRKHWRYVGVFGAQLMACVGLARIGPGWTSWWAVWDRELRVLRERTHFRRAGIRLEPGVVRVRDRALRIELALDEDAVPPVEVYVPDGPSYAWTAKRAAVPVRGEIELDGMRHELDGPLAFIDDSAGYHRRDTSWFWSAGMGHAVDGRPIAWNLVDSINDPPERSERTVWIDGEPREVGPNRFADDLSGVAFAEGGGLAFTAEASRERDDNLLIFRSTYSQPFGTFTGILPGGLELADGFGVMERHRARW